MIPGYRILAIAFPALALALAVGCSSGSKDEQALNAATATPTATRTPAATATPAATSTPIATATSGPTSTPTIAVPTVEPLPVSPTDSPAGGEATPVSPSAAQVQLTPTEIGQGQSATLTVSGYGAGSAMAIFDDRRYPLVAQNGSYWGIIAAAGDAQTGTHAITIDLSDVNGDVLAELTAAVTVVDMGYPVENIDLPADVNNSLDPALIQQENDARASTFAQFTAQKLWSGPFIWPVQPVVVSPYGIRRGYNGGPVNSFHQGIDLAADEGVPVAAANTGRVAYVGTGPTHGNSVLIDHGDGVFSGYGHLSAFAVQVGQMVNKDDLVGYVGSTGMATGPHLHWEMIVRGVPVDPMPWTLQSMGP
jgi:murein DD-endopeptidase MepM/ murein hydrolase activator NlpD